MNKTTCENCGETQESLGFCYGEELFSWHTCRRLQYMNESAEDYNKYLRKCGIRNGITGEIDQVYNNNVKEKTVSEININNMIAFLTPGPLFFDYLNITKRVLMKKEGSLAFYMFWIISPLLPVYIIGWYLGELLARHTP